MVPAELELGIGLGIGLKGEPIPTRFPPDGALYHFGELERVYKYVNVPEAGNAASGNTILLTVSEYLIVTVPPARLIRLARVAVS